MSWCRNRVTLSLTFTFFFGGGEGFLPFGGKKGGFCQLRNAHPPEPTKDGRNSTARPPPPLLPERPRCRRLRSLRLVGARLVTSVQGVRPGSGGTWRIIPVSKWLITMVSKSPKRGYSPSKWPKWLINRGYSPLTKWDDPPSNWEA